MRDGDWKLILPSKKDRVEPELFNLAADPFEATDQAQNEPARVAALTVLLKQLSVRDRDVQVDPTEDQNK